MVINKKKTLFFVLFGIIFTLLYILVGVRSLSKEYNFLPEWKINISSGGTTNDFVPKKTNYDESKNNFYFKLGQNLGYFTEDGEITLYKSFPSKASISDYFYAFYNTDGNNIDFFDNQGKLISTLKEKGYPFFDEDRIYVFLPGGSSFVRCDETGKRSWIYEGIIPITAFSSNSSYTAVGFADGNIKLFNNIDGSIEISYEPGGSDYSVIYGIDISSDGKYIASVSGRDKQRFVIAKREKNQPKIIFHDFLDSDITRRTVVHFSQNNDKVLYNYGETLGIYDFNENKRTCIKLKNPLLSIEETDNLFFLLGKNDSNYTVYSIEKTNSLQGSFSFEASSAFIKTYNNSLYVGKNNTISRLKVTKD